MALTATAVKDVQGSPIHSVGDLVAAFVDVAFSGSYATGGDALDLGPTLRRGGGPGQAFLVVTGDKAGYDFEYDYTNKKLIVRHGDNANAAAGPEVEIAAAAYPAALTTGSLRIFVMGR